MSILIKDREAPPSCVKCPLMRDNECDVVPRWFSEDFASKLYHGRLDGCPIVEVVMCKDCKWHGYLTCSNPNGLKVYVTDDDTCSYGEKKGDTNGSSNDDEQAKRR